MFTCSDMWVKWGSVKYDPELIERWEKNPRKLNRLWNLAIMSLLYNRAIRVEDLDPEKNFKLSSSYKRMMGNTKMQSHESHIRLEQAKRLRAKVDENKKMALEKKMNELG